jgi:hypothetical protein
MPKDFAPQLLPQNLINLGLVLGLLFFAFGCFWSSDRNSVTSKSDAEPAPEKTEIPAKNYNSSTTPTKNENGKQDRGDFIVQHGAVQNQRYTEIDRQIKEGKTLETAANQLNQNLKLPTDVYLKTKDCDEINAQYDPNDKTITICYELMEHFLKIFKGSEKTEQDAYNKMFDAVRFAFLHELGHAMIDLYKLPITGNEEDAADRASAYICLEEIDDGVKSVLAAADAFSFESKNQKPIKQDMADEHLLQQQRFYNSLCMIYGSNTVKYSNLKDNGYLPTERAERCPSEYEKTMQSWKELLKPWRKN